ncbi:MAG TPA: hypothetical protein VK426_05555 [Methanobacterium sp.]|nr:hypothetical protein [Methanobacterium sp.]
MKKKKTGGMGMEMMWEKMMKMMSDEDMKKMASMKIDMKIMMLEKKLEMMKMMKDMMK